MVRRFPALAATLVSVLIAAVPAAAGGYSPGSDSGGDPFFPQAGNGGYDVRHYSLRIDYDHAPANELDGRTIIIARPRRTSRASTSTCATS